MLVDSNKLESGTLVESDVCIVGGGPAGINLALEFKHSGHTVTLFESGDYYFDAKTQALYEGEADGALLGQASPYLTYSRLRYFGGTANHWSGWCRPLDPVDFEKRDWIPYSGWPFPHTELDSYYHRAARALQIRDVTKSDSKRQPAAPPLFGSDEDLIVTKFFHVSWASYHKPDHRLPSFHRAFFQKVPWLKIYFNSNVTEISLNANGSSVDHLEISTLEGKTLKAKAKQYIIACGGIENARLLLASNSVQKSGIGNQHDLVGRFFMEHPHVNQAGRFVFHVDPKLLGAYDTRLDPVLKHMTVGVLCPSDHLLKDEQLLNFCVQLKTHEMRHDIKVYETQVAFDASTMIDEMRGTAQDSSEMHLPSSSVPCIIPILMRIEQVPNPESRVTLSTRMDPFGKQFAHLNWQVTEQDVDNYRRNMKIVGGEIGRKRVGRLDFLEEEIRLPAIAHGGNHHIGTTRMHVDSKQGVTDGDCKVHGVSNLYMAGSSLFPTCGFANPTYTIVALAIRLADKLKLVLKG